VASDAGLKTKGRFTFFPKVNNSEGGIGLFRQRANVINSDQ